MQLQNITPDQLSRFYRELQLKGGKDGGPLSPNTVRRVHATVHRALRDAARWGHLQRNQQTRRLPSVAEQNHRT